MLKFGRTYTLTVETNNSTKGITFTDPLTTEFIPGNFITIKDPLTLEFSITRKFLQSVNTGTFRIYNLGLTTRNAIYRDPFSYLNPDKIRSITLKAGYGANQSIIFNGSILKANSTKISGSTEFMTEIVAFDGGPSIVNAFSSGSYSPNTPRSQVISDVINDVILVGDVQIGSVTNLYGDAKYPRGRALMGRSWGILQVETGQRAFIDNGRLYVLADNEFAGTDTLVISGATGLLGSPVRGDKAITVNVLFEPQAYIGQRAELISENTPIYNGIWQIRGIHHSGIISGAICGSVITTLDLLVANTNFENVAQLAAA